MSSYGLTEVDIPAWRYELVLLDDCLRVQQCDAAHLDGHERIRIKNEREDEDAGEGPDDDLSLGSDSMNDEDYSEMEEEDAEDEE
ncbi:hypothetical protein CANCADRAFT_4502 [Tortispora caseinolytica NRRL Y-17796]|uniref:Uncharacterized protein n=1 Tax=Tortispora caseinolytica NRRL Y-17796 TaxID=767744 RepID=A0A1E4T9F6_9ASCO|nr:hypothetical protein CANCADRAFT_4502 [Tortispora caseinolytica NRRL Y-17796]